MGREAYLTRLAFGRSAFEPPGEVVPSSVEDAQPQATATGAAASGLQHPSREYVQAYSERGHPVNPAAREHGRRLREAQNDVLAAIGVVERRTSNTPQTENERRLRQERLEDEELIGNGLALASKVTKDGCTWWIGSLRDRILTFRIRDALPFSNIVASEYQAAGREIIYAGFPARFLSTISVQATVYTVFSLQPLGHLLASTRISRGTKRTLRSWRNVIDQCFRLSVEFFFYPFAYHASLQRLGLIRARPFLPPWAAFVPFSEASPLGSVYLPTSFTVASVTAWFKSALESPLLLVVAEHMFERWLFAMVNEATEASIIQPNNPDIVNPNDEIRNRSLALKGFRNKAPPFLRTAINKFLIAIGWGVPYQDWAEAQPRQRRRAISVAEQEQMVEVGGVQITDLTHLDIPTVQQDVLMDSLAELPPPASPTASETSRHGDANDSSNDPRIRITSRDGIVEMEVRLPPQLMSSHIDVPGTAPLTPNQLEIPMSPSPREPDPPSVHRVTALSREPSQRLGAIFKAQFIAWAALPLKMLALRAVASHYLWRNAQYAGGLHRSPTMPGIPQYTTLRSAGMGASRIALCSALEVAISLTLWGLQWAAVAKLGKRYFDWGRL